MTRAGPAPVNLCYGGIVLPAEAANMPRYRPGRTGFYEVWFVELQDDRQETALWLRFGLRAPADPQGPELAELWAMVYDRNDPRKSFGLKRSIPLAQAKLGDARFELAVGEASIDHKGCRGRIDDAGRSIEWDLRWEQEGELILHFPYAGMYSSPFPRTKFLSPHFDLRASGHFSADGRVRSVTRAAGQQSHLWGTQQARRWRWCHASTFQEDPNAAFEALTVDMPFLPSATVFALKIGGETYLFHGPLDLLNGNESRLDGDQGASGSCPVARWVVGGGDAELRFRGEISAPLESYLGVLYVDPDGSKRYAAHSKLAEVRLELLFPDGNGGWRVGQTLSSGPTAALEFVGSAPDPRVPITVT